MFGSGSSLELINLNKNHFVAEIAEKLNCEVIFSKKTLIDLLEKKLSFPDKYRDIMWRYILQLPMNLKQYVILSSQPNHPLLKNLTEKLPIKFAALSHRLFRLLSALIYWHPPLAECEWLPSFVYPFLCIYGRDKIATFESIMTIIVNWCGEWLHFIPNPPITILSRIDRIARDHGGNAPLSKAWPALRSLFGEVSTTQAAKMMLDNVLSSEPSFLEYLVASYCLLKNDSIIDELSIKFVISRAKKYYEKELSTNPNTLKFNPLPQGYYPTLPIVVKSQMWREKELQRIRKEAEASKQQTSLVTEIEKETAKIERQRRSWMAERAFLRDIEEEQMEEFRRREMETLTKENLIEEDILKERKEKLNLRKIDEENSIRKWENDTKKVQDEMKNAVEMRRSTWSKWLDLKENAAKLTQEETDIEIMLLEEREKAHEERLQEHNNTMNKEIKQEQQMLADAIRRGQELEEEKNILRETLEKARRKQADKIAAKQKRLLTANQI